MTPSELTAREIFLRALAACSIERAFAKLVVCNTSTAPPVTPPATHPVAQLLHLHGIRRLLVIAMGKAGVSMLAALLNRSDIVHGRELRGILVAPQPLDPMPPGFTFFPGAHPLPAESSFTAARAILQLFDSEPPSSHTLCLFLISGGASAMVELPLNSSITLEETIAFHRAVVHSGAAIAEMNCLRKHFSAVKGGRLAQRASHLRQLTLFVSDVAPQHLDALASGPTLPDTSTVADCRDILARYNLLPQLPPSVAAFFSSAALPETPKPGALVAPHLVLLSSADLAEQARLAATSLGYTAFIDNGCDDWDYRDAAHHLVHRVRELRTQHPRVCLISAGEVTVRVPPLSETVRAQPSGGRNQHLVLYAATQLHEPDCGLTILSCGSDGIDGNSPAAGAVLSFDSLDSPCREQWMRSATEALNTFSSFNFLHAQGRTIQTGPTGNNLRDLRILLAE